MPDMFQVATGHDNTAGLADMVQDPAIPRGLEYPELRWAANVSAAWHGLLFADLEWNVLQRLPSGATPSVRDQLLAQFGLSDAVASAAVTVRLRDNGGNFANYNATAALVDQGARAQGRWERVVVRLNNLVLIAEPGP